MARYIKLCYMQIFHLRSNFSNFFKRSRETRRSYTRTRDPFLLHTLLHNNHPRSPTDTWCTRVPRIRAPRISLLLSASFFFPFFFFFLFFYFSFFLNLPRAPRGNRSCHAPLPRSIFPLIGGLITF